MSRLLRCGACGKEMVLEPYHLGREVPCPWCGGRNEVPKELDFHAPKTAARKDETAGAWLLAGSIVNLVLCGACLPLGAFVWGSANGRLHRAAEEDRPADPMLRAARLVAAIGVVLGTIALLGVGVGVVLR